MIVRDRKYKPKIISILSESFDENASINFIVRQDKLRRQRIKYLMDFCFEVCLDRGTIFLSQDQCSCALLLDSDTMLPWYRTAILNIKLAARSIGISRIFRVFKREKLIKSNHPKGNYYYLWFIGVDPNEQGKGKGSALLNELLEYCDKASRPVYLETSVLSNLPWYERYGFRIFNEIDIGYRLFQMIRN